MVDYSTVDQNVFHHEFSLVVSSSSVNFDGARVYIQKYVSELMLRGNNSNSPVMLLSGSHGFKEQKDALCDLKGIKSLPGKDGKLIPRQTRKFNEVWCDFFSVGC